MVRVRVTIVSFPPHDITKGQQYLGACILTSMHGSNTVGKDRCFNPPRKEGQAKWQPYQHFSILPDAFSTGDWNLHLELMTRWETPDDLEVPYALTITVEDPTATLDVYEAIRTESQGRFQTMDRAQIRM